MLIKELLVEGKGVPLSKEFIQQVRAAWDLGFRPREIAELLGIENSKNITNVLTKHYPTRQGKQFSVFPEELIQKVKDAWDSGIHSNKNISKVVGCTPQQANIILRTRYANRSGKMKITATDDMISQMKAMYDANWSYQEIGKKLGLTPKQTNMFITRYYKERKKRNLGEPKGRVVTEDDIKEMIKLYRRGYSTPWIGKKYWLSPTNVLKWFQRRLSHAGYLKLLADNKAARTGKERAGRVTRGITKPGSFSNSTTGLPNLHGQAPGGKHQAGTRMRNKGFQSE